MIIDGNPRKKFFHGAEESNGELTNKITYIIVEKYSRLQKLFRLLKIKNRRVSNSEEIVDERVLLASSPKWKKLFKLTTDVEGVSMYGHPVLELSTAMADLKRVIILSHWLSLMQFNHLFLKLGWERWARAIAAFCGCREMKEK